jgi:diamine N-acetyltransferase
MEISDIDLLYQWENDPSIWKVSNTLSPFSSYQIEEFVKQSGNDVFQNRQLRMMIDLITEGEDPVSIGTIDLFDLDPFHQRAGVGILIIEPFRGKGYAREAIEILINYSFSVLMLHQLYTHIGVSNKRSIALFEGRGFERCGAKREWLRTENGWEDEWMYQLLG